MLEHAGRMLVRTGSRSRGAASQRLDAGLVRHLVVGGAGGKMLVDGIKGEEAEEATELSAGALFMQGVATRIDYSY